MPALDGLRAIAVAGVLLYHAELPWFQGGFLGVDVFFVISGYLITSLLIGEWNQTGKIDLAAFWLRRARRLLPALFLLLGAVLVFSVFFMQEEVARLRSDGLAAFGYVTNWYLIFNEQSYFATMGRPSLFQHLWSLAVEEQFYVLGPLLFVLLMKFARPFVIPVVLGGVLFSALLMAILYSPLADQSRVYYGTDTRAAGLLVGVALAFLLSRIRITAARRAWADILTRDVPGVAALGAITLFFICVNEAEAFLYQGGFLVLEVAVAVLIASIALPGGRVLTRLLGSFLPRWIGLRSYGIYLWHWPVFMLTRPDVDVQMDGLLGQALRLATTLGLAQLSYRMVETPIRKGAIQQLWRELKTAQGRRERLPSLRWAAVATVAMLAIVGPSIVSAKPPAPPDYLSLESINTVDDELTTPEIIISGEATETVPSPLPGIETAIPPDSTPTAIAPTATSYVEPTLEPTTTPEPTATATATLTPTATSTPVVPPTATPTATATPTDVVPEEILATYVYTTVGLPVFLPAELAPTAEPELAAAATVDVIGPGPTAEPVNETTPTQVTTEVISPTEIALNPIATTAAATAMATATGSPDATPTLTWAPGDVASLGRIVAIGDSVMLGAAKEVIASIPNFAIDAKVSRQASNAIELLQSYKDNGKLEQVVLIHIGSNGYFTEKQFDQMMSVLADRKWVVFVNVRVPRKWEAPNNTVIVEGVARYPNAVLIDWFAASVEHREYFAKDGYHLQISGQKAYTSLIEAKLKVLAMPTSPVTPLSAPSPTP